MAAPARLAPARCLVRSLGSSHTRQLLVWLLGGSIVTRTLKQATFAFAFALHNVSVKLYHGMRCMAAEAMLTWRSGMQGAILMPHVGASMCDDVFVEYCWC